MTNTYNRPSSDPENSASDSSLEIYQAAGEGIPYNEGSVGPGPRERLLMFGPGMLSDVEVLALVLGGATSIERAQSVLDRVGGLAGLSQACAHELQELPGIGVARAASIAAAAELKKRLDRDVVSLGQAIDRPSRAVTLLRSILYGAQQENFVILGLDSRQRARMVRIVALGTVSYVAVHPREVFRPLIRAGVHSCLIAHNHPSGDPEPSDEDIALTRLIVSVGKFLGIHVVDHIVISDYGFVSMNERKMIDGMSELDEILED